MPFKQQKGKTLEETDLKDLEELLQKKRELINETTLSEREAEVYVLYKHRDVGTIEDVAEILEISPNTVQTFWRKIKDKHIKAKITARLDV